MSHDVLSGWRSRCPVLLELVTMLEKLHARYRSSSSLPRTPPGEPSLDKLLLDGSFPDGTKLWQLDSLLESATNACMDLLSPPSTALSEGVVLLEPRRVRTLICVGSSEKQRHYSI